MIIKVKLLIDAGLLVSPWLAGVGNRSRFDGDIFEYLDGQAQSISELQWTEIMQTETFGEEIPAPDRVPRTALYEILASTAVWIAHEETGTGEVTYEFAEQALQRMRSFIKEYGLSTLVEVYVIATRYENYQAVAYFGQMSEREFVLGHLHRPWVDYSLQDELILGVLTGNFQIRMVDGHRKVSLTVKGQASYRMMQDLLGKSGYLSQRIRHLHVSRFNAALVFEEVVHKMGPDWIPQRQEFVDWLDIKPGMRVLEIGCGDGLLTIDGGLADRVGPSGTLVAMDPSKGMLSRLERKLQQNSRPWVQLVQASAEILPFEDGTFDMVVGAAFLHLTDIPKALAQLRRVTRPRGILGLFNLLPFGMDAPFFMDWMEPLRNLATKDKRKEPKTYLLSAETIAEELGKAGLDIVKTRDVVTRTLFWWPNDTIDILIRGLGWAQEELSTIPWAAREEMIALLQERGEDICRRYTQEERVLNAPMQMVRAHHIH